MGNTDIKLQQVNSESERIAKTIKGGEVMALIGALGSGKTTFVKKTLKNLGLNKRVTSPTFIISNEFLIKPGKNNKFKKPVQVFHLDLYRTKSYKEIESLGITELWGKPNTLTFIEWADKIKHHLPINTKYVYFTNKDSGKN